MKNSLIQFDPNCDQRGTLFAFENNKNIPFDIKRVYTILHTSPDYSRGYHAHKNDERVIVCLQGACKFLMNNGTTRGVTILDSPAVGLYVKPWVWIEIFDLTQDCILLVLSSSFYDPSDYIRTYDEFITLLEERKEITKG